MAQSDSLKRPGLGALPWVAVTLFALVGVGIVIKLVASLSGGQLMAFLLELTFALLWLLIATAYVVDIRKKQARTRERRLRAANRPTQRPGQ